MAWLWPGSYAYGTRQLPADSLSRMVYAGEAGYEAKGVAGIDDCYL